MEWLVVVACALIAATLIALPARSASPPDAAREESLREEHRLLLAELRELDEDAAAGRIAEGDRRDGRRALAPRLRAVTEALRAAGDRAPGASRPQA